MADYLSTPCTAFAGSRRIATGALIDVALAVRDVDPAVQGPLLTFDNASGAVIDLDLRGSTADIVARLRDHGDHQRSKAEGGGTGGAARSPGRPKLGVVAREVTLLPRHWEWLGRQQGGASQALRRMVDDARRADDGQTVHRAAQERTYRFLAAIAGDLSGFEDAIRALFAGDHASFADRMAAWPADIRDHALLLAEQAPATTA